MACTTKVSKTSTIDEISNEQIRLKLLEVITKCLNTTHYDWSIERGSKKGDNFMGEVYRIVYQDKDNVKNRTSLILKVAPKNVKLREKLKSHSLFVREIMMYDEVLKQFKDFQLSKNITPDQNGFYEVPKCLASVSENLSECLFLEDLKLRQFEMFNHRQEPITFEHMSLLMKALAKFHAISFALKDQQPEKFRKLSDLLVEQFWTVHLSTLFKIQFNNFLDTLREGHRFDLCKKLQKVAGTDCMATVLSLLSGASAEPYSVICHGDATTNNTMFRKNDQGKVIDIQLFDWQFSRYASPVTDLVLYLWCSSSKELRAKHYDDFLRIYHETLSEFLTRLGSKSTLFSFEALLAEFKKFGVYAVFVGAILIPLLIGNAENMPDVNELVEKLDSQKEFSRSILHDSVQKFKEYIVDMVDDMARYGYI